MSNHIYLKTFFFDKYKHKPKAIVPICNLKLNNIITITHLQLFIHAF